MTDHEERTEARILALLKKSPREGAEAVIEEYSPLVWHTAAQHLRDPEDIREVVNDVFCTFLTQQDRFDPQKGSLKLWLVRMARTRAINRYRKNTRKPETVPLEDVPDQTVPEDQAAERMDLKQALEELSPEEAELIRLKYYHGMTVREIAEAMHLPYETVKKRHQRSLQKLRILLTAGFILLLAVLLAACAFFILRHFGILPGIGVATEADSVVYSMPQPTAAEREDGALRVTDAYYMEGTLFLRTEVPYRGTIGERLAQDALPGADSPEETDWMMNAAVSYGGETGGLLAIPQRNEDGLVVELYTLNTGEMPMTSMLICDSNREGKTGDITLIGEDGTEYTAEYWHNPEAMQPSGTVSFWNFGDVPPGSYTVRVPYVYLEAGKTEMEFIPLNLQDCTWEERSVSLPQGTLTLTSCEAVGPERVPEEMKADRGWILTLYWDLPTDTDLTLNPEQIWNITHPAILEDGQPGQSLWGNGVSKQDMLRTVRAEGNEVSFFLSPPTDPDCDLTQTALTFWGKMSYRSDMGFEIPIHVDP